MDKIKSQKRGKLWVKNLTLAIVLPALFVSCAKSGALTGGGSTSGGSYGSSITGSVNGGLSPVAGATVTLFSLTPGASSAATLATATTGSNGAYNLIFTNPGGAVLATATGLNHPEQFAIDAGGNVWVIDGSGGSGTVISLNAATTGPQFFPYSGPQYP